MRERDPERLAFMHACTIACSIPRTLLPMSWIIAVDVAVAVALSVTVVVVAIINKLSTVVKVAFGKLPCWRA